jgi:hypothetical protein
MLMIAQFIDNVVKNNPQTNIINWSNNRFFHDRSLSILSTLNNPRIGGKVNDNALITGEIFIIQFKFGKQAADTTGMRLRLTNGVFLNYTNAVTKISDTEIDIATKIEKEINICFQVTDTWSMEFGRRSGTSTINWTTAAIVFDYIAIIKSSMPTDENTMSLPRFITSPEYGFEVLGSDMRGSIGQPYGHTIRQLKNLKVNYVKVKAETIEDYFRKVSITEPHFIVPYPENVEVIPPFWACLSTAPELTKRTENGWAFNTKLSWREAY